MKHSQTLRIKSAIQSKSIDSDSSYRKFWDIHESMTSPKRNQENKSGPGRMGKVGKLL